MVLISHIFYKQILAFPFLGFYSWDVTDRHKMNLNNSEPIKEKEEMSTEDYERDKEMIVKEMNVKTIG